ncbi:hypothetical protein QQS21_006406 [Conoideocrella luteorostrata]|uniref:Uncharacterized protein n=1 Tax=Conoideocrella luteorostrata TaxID=1105319 RepID=A0AAJ0CMK0_9HYPO|nr:hypothetical protein QQS21_006406 [Conoideocrella luteorostrata]
MRSLFSNYARQSTLSAPSPSLPPTSSSSSKSTTRSKAILCDTPGVGSGSQRTSIPPKYALGISDGEIDEDNEDDIAVTVTIKSVGSASSSCSSVSSVSSDFHATMSIRNKAKRQIKGGLSTPNPPNTVTGNGRPTTPTSPVQIPKRSHRDNSHHVKKENSHHRRQPRHLHCPDSISPSVAALLAITDIPRPQRRRRQAGRPLTVDEIVSDQYVSEKELSLSLGRGPLDLLLSPPEDMADDDLSATESNIGSMMTRTISADSVPSLAGESFATDIGSSIDTPRSMSSSARRRHSPMRKSLEPIRSPPDTAEEHPLAGADDVDLEGLELPSPEESGGDSSSYPLLQPFKPLRSAFKSNLTASLRALRSAAKSFSNINFPSIPADDFLTRSILTIDPNVPYTDERRPPVTEEMPSAELRRYLNPTTSKHLDTQPISRPAGTFSASIQMQTYKVQRSKSAPAPARAPCATGNTSQAGSTNNSQHPTKAGQHSAAVPGMRQREMRENPDFIRIAVMEMAMRRRGKLDNQKPGRARWALPPRRPQAKPYDVGVNGVPTRWIPVTY